MWVLGGAAPTKLPLPPTPYTHFLPNNTTPLHHHLRGPIVVPGERYEH